MFSRICLVLLIVIVGCAPASRVPRPPARIFSSVPSYSRYPTAKRQIDSLLPDSLFPPAGVSIRVVSVESGEILYDLNSDRCRNPASNLKLLTSALALRELSPSYTFATIAYADTVGGPLIILHASGDPILSTEDLDTLAGRIARRLPSGRTWILAADVSLFDDQERGKGWVWDDEPDPTAMFISPLSLNGNCVRVMVRPGSAIGEPAQVTTQPSTSFVTIENSAVTKPAGGRETIHVSRMWQERSNRITVSGEIPLSDSISSETISITGPEWYAMTVLKEKLGRQGVQVGPLMLDSIPARAFELGRIEHSIDTVLTYMNRTSDNLSAENLLKVTASLRTGSHGSAEEGIHLLREYLWNTGVDTAKIVIVDGSGVSRYNLVTAYSLVRVLVSLHARHDLFPLFYQSLPVAGVNGTLSQRMRGTPAEGNVHAKTGTLEGVSTLSGYVTTADRDLLAFSIFMEHFPSSSRPYRQVQDRICTFLASFRRPSP
jgi:D-alanyl-D-alanine carboxypeptidase/D-alanyl-D-alanine-endopeptidase (penicillin-binding protein 4)